MGRDPFGIFKEGEVHTISYNMTVSNNWEHKSMDQRCSDVDVSKATGAF
jgi:hypothetical protein